MFQILSTPQSPSLNCHCLFGSHKRISLPTLQSLRPSGAHICLSWMVPIPLQHCNQSPGSSTQSCKQGHHWLPLFHPLLEAQLPPLKLTLEHQTLYSFERALRLPPDFSSLYALAIKNVPCRLKKKPSWRPSRKSDCSACGHPLQDLNHLLLDCPASEPLRKSIFGSSLSILDLWSRPWGVARLLGLHGVPPRPHPSEGVG